MSNATATVNPRTEVPITPTLMNSFILLGYQNQQNLAYLVVKRLLTKIYYIKLQLNSQLRYF